MCVAVMESLSQATSLRAENKARTTPMRQCCAYTQLYKPKIQHPAAHLSSIEPKNESFPPCNVQNIWVYSRICLCVAPPLLPAVFHPVECSYCHTESMMGFRYRCQQCHNYQLCQDCFWRGHASGSHSNQHQMKEYTSWVRERKAHQGRCVCSGRAVVAYPLQAVGIRSSDIT